MPRRSGVQLGLVCLSLCYDDMSGITDNCYKSRFPLTRRTAPLMNPQAGMISTVFGVSYLLEQEYEYET